MQPHNADLFIFVLAGGSGERFWPLSRKQKPKQLLGLFSERTLLEETLLRVEGVAPASQILILTNEAQKQTLLDALPGISPDRVIAEPAKRDTAPAAALATALAWSQNPDSIVVLLPSDQLVKNIEAFRRNLHDSIRAAAETKAIVTLAIQPTHPATGFGYLELAEELPASGSTRFHRVSRFVEKPALEKAQEYLQSGSFQWNAGMFIWKASTFLVEAERQSPELAAFIRNFPKSGADAYIADKFPTLPKISVDYAIMEKAAQVLAARSDFDWDDVGCWTSLADHLPADASGNVVQGKVISLESSGNIVYSPAKTVALCGVSDLIVVETPDALLVCHRDKVQEIKKLLPALPPDLL